VGELVVRASTKLIKLRYLLSAILAAAILIYGRLAGLPLDTLLIVPAALAVWTALQHLSLRFTTLRIAGGKLHFAKGVLSRSTRSLELAKVQDVRVDQSIGQRLLNLGNLTLETAGETSTVTMLNVDRPRQVADLILGEAGKS
jgi:uncharacterized membrane protein YdbT with pleckstrin-like domain